MTTPSLLEHDVAWVPSECCVRWCTALARPAASPQRAHLAGKLMLQARKRPGEGRCMAQPSVPYSCTLRGVIADDFAGGHGHARARRSPWRGRGRRERAPQGRRPRAELRAPRAPRRRTRGAATRCTCAPSERWARVARLLRPAWSIGAPCRQHWRAWSTLQVGSFRPLNPPSHASLT